MVDIKCLQFNSRSAVPLFIMLTGALLLQPNKTDEPLGNFFKKTMEPNRHPRHILGGNIFCMGLSY